jgi:hypothetical protein
MSSKKNDDEFIDENRLHIYARELVDKYKSDGSQFDKKQLRFNDIVNIGLHYSRCGTIPSQAIAESGIHEAVEACIIGNLAHIKGGSILSMINKWMEV